MNKYLYIPLMITAVFSYGKTAYCEKIMGIGYSWENSPKTQVYELEDLDEELMEKCLKGDFSDEIIIHFPEGTILPVSFSVDGDLLITKKEIAPLLTMPIKISQDFFLKILKGDVQFAKELGDWKPFTEFTTGEIKASISKTPQYGLNINMEGIFFLRK